MLDLNDIAMFVQVVRSGSFAEAARRLGLPPNTVSHRVQQLEAHLGTRLLQRSTRKLTLTSAGQGFHERCAGAVDGLLEAEQELMTGSSAPSGLVRVAAPAPAARGIGVHRVGDPEDECGRRTAGASICAASIASGGWAFTPASPLLVDDRPAFVSTQVRENEERRSSRTPI